MNFSYVNTVHIFSVATSEKVSAAVLLHGHVASSLCTLFLSKSGQYYLGKVLSM